MLYTRTERPTTAETESQRAADDGPWSTAATVLRCYSELGIRSVTRNVTCLYRTASVPVAMAAATLTDYRAPMSIIHVSLS